jgi:hypothetical protein
VLCADCRAWTDEWTDQHESGAYSYELSYADMLDVPEGS